MMATENIISSSRKNNKTRRETAVQGTNDSSIVSKCSTAACGYYEDPFLHFFVSKMNRRAPLIHRGYYIRAVAFQKIIRNFLMQHKGRQKQIISLGCGFDSSFFRLKAGNLLENTEFFGIDFPELVKRKRLLIENTKELSNLIEKVEESPPSPHIELSCKDYHLLGVDLTQLNTLEAALKMCGLNFEYPTLLFSECVMTYMTRRCSTELVKWAAETFENAVFAMYEQINPDDAFGLFMQNHFHSIGSPLKCINSFPTLDSQIKRFQNSGWATCEAIDMNTFYYQCIPIEERQRINNLEAFDEYEELNLKYSHYFILTASSNKQGSSLISDTSLQSPVDPLSVKDSLALKLIPPENQCVRRFGHSTSLVDGRFAVTTGGFGEIDGRHQRLSEITVTDLDTLKSFHVAASLPDIQGSRMHHMSVPLADGSVYLYGGRQSPYFMCNQMLKIRLHCSKSNTCNRDIQNCDFSDQDQENLRSSSFGQTRNSKSGNSFESDHRPLNSERKPNDSTDINSSHVHISNISIGVSTDVCDTKDCNSGLQKQNHTESDTGAYSESAATCGKSTHYMINFDLGHLEVEVISQLGDIPQQRWRHGLVPVTFQGKEKLFLYGGKTKDGSVLEDCYLFDPLTAEWQKLCLSGQHPGPRHSHFISFWKGHVVLSGGLDADHVPVGVIHLLDLDTLTWRTFDYDGILYPRYSHTCHVSGDNLILIGGVNLQHPPPGVAILCLTTKQAKEFALSKPNKDNLLMFHRHTSLQLNDRLVIFGGGGNCFSFGTHLNRTPVVMDVSQCLEIQ